jgi:hypothetical protein
MLCPGYQRSYQQLFNPQPSLILACLNITILAKSDAGLFSRSCYEK